MAPRKDYTPEQMGKAIEAVRKGEKIATAAKKFGIPRITLHDKVTGKTPIGCTMGPSTVLTKTEEEILVRWLIALSLRHIPMTKDNLLDSVQKIITEQNRPNPFTNNRPSKKWFKSFLKRHPEITQKIPDNLSRARDNVTENDITNWFQEIDNYLEENNLKSILADPNRVFNADESAFFLSPKPGHVLAKKGEKHLYSACGDEKDNLTVLITGNAAGVLAPPMIIYNYERIPASISASIPDEWAIGKSDSGWMCSDTFYEYMTNIFNPWLEQNNIEKPVIFFVDGHKSHLTLHLSKFCSENGIEVMALYPNSTHILQPMDLSVFRPLKVHWKKAVTEWKLENLGQNLRKENFAPVLQKALTKITKDCIKNGFRAGGLFPFGPNYIDMSKIRQRQVSSTEKTIDPAQAEFVKYLDREIVKIFSDQKLKQFNDLFFKDRKAVEDNLPDEDMSLYMIWAKNRSETLPNVQINNEVTGHNTATNSLPSNANLQKPEDGKTGTENKSEEAQHLLDVVPLSNTKRRENTPIKHRSDNILTLPTEDRSQLLPYVPNVPNNENIFEQPPPLLPDGSLAEEISHSDNYDTDTATNLLPPSTKDERTNLQKPENSNTGTDNKSDEAQRPLDVVPSLNIRTREDTPIKHRSDSILTLPTEDRSELLPNVLNLPTTNENIFEQPPPLLPDGSLEEEISHTDNHDTDSATNLLPPGTKDQRTTLQKSEDSNTGTENKSDEAQHPLDVVPSLNIRTREDTPIEHRSDNLLTLSSVEENVLTRPSLDLLPDTSMEQLISTRQPNIHTGTDNVTPHKKSMETVLGVTIPSPFKRSLFWPGDELNKKKRIKREKIPSTVTSKAWKEYYEKKELEKKKNQEEKEKRAKLRIEKKKLKDQLAEDKRSKSKLKGKVKKRTREKSTSEDTDLEIRYAESDASYNLEDDEELEIENSAKKIKRVKKSSYKQQSPLLDSDMDNIPLNKLVSSQSTKLNKRKNLLPGNFVIVKYEGEYFPGKVEKVHTDNKYEVSTMILTKGNTFRWPNTPDKILYSRDEIIEVIKEPICLNKRGFYRIFEMDKYLPDIYDH